MIRAAVHVQLVQAEREQLHQFARVILVGLRAGRGVGLAVAQERQERSHRRIRRDRVHELAEIAERIVEQHVDIGGGRERLPVACSRRRCPTTSMSSSAMPTRWRSWSGSAISPRHIVASKPASLLMLAAAL